MVTVMTVSELAAVSVNSIRVDVVVTVFGARALDVGIARVLVGRLGL